MEAKKDHYLLHYSESPTQNEPIQGRGGRHNNLPKGNEKARLLNLRAVKPKECKIRTKTTVIFLGKRRGNTKRFSAGGGEGPCDKKESWKKTRKRSDSEAQTQFGQRRKGSCYSGKQKALEIHRKNGHEQHQDGALERNRAKVTQFVARGLR